MNYQNPARTLVEREARSFRGLALLVLACWTAAAALYVVFFQS